MNPLHEALKKKMMEMKSKSGGKDMVAGASDEHGNMSDKDMMQSKANNDDTDLAPDVDDSHMDDVGPDDGDDLNHDPVTGALQHGLDKMGTGDEKSNDINHHELLAMMTGDDKGAQMDSKSLTGRAKGMMRAKMAAMVKKQN